MDRWDCEVMEEEVFFQGEGGIRECGLSRGVGDGYKRQKGTTWSPSATGSIPVGMKSTWRSTRMRAPFVVCMAP